MDTKQLITRAIAICGGSQQALAEKAGVSQGLISQFLQTDKRPGWKACIGIESATNGEISRYALRPDVFGPKPGSKVERASA